MTGSLEEQIYQRVAAYLQVFEAVDGAKEPKIPVIIHLPDIHGTHALRFAHPVGGTKKACVRFGDYFPDALDRFCPDKVFAVVLGLILIDGIHA